MGLAGDPKLFLVITEMPMHFPDLDGGARPDPTIIENKMMSIHFVDARTIEIIWNSMQLLGFESVVVGRAVPVDFGVVGIYGCGPWLPTCPLNPHTTLHNPPFADGSGQPCLLKFVCLPGY